MLSFLYHLPSVSSQSEQLKCESGPQDLCDFMVAGGFLLLYGSILSDCICGLVFHKILSKF